MICSGISLAVAQARLHGRSPNQPPLFLGHLAKNEPRNFWETIYFIFRIWFFGLLNSVYLRFSCAHELYKDSVSFGSWWIWRRITCFVRSFSRFSSRLSAAPFSKRMFRVIRIHFTVGSEICIISFVLSDFQIDRGRQLCSPNSTDISIDYPINPQWITSGSPLLWIGVTLRNVMVQCDMKK
jgi:hypothetical protein